MTRRACVLSVFLMTAFATSAAGQAFGGAVTVSGNQIFVGETGNATLPGILYVYERGADGWRESRQLSITAEAGAPDGFGRSVAADGRTLLVGAPQLRDGAGAVVLYAPGGSGGWTETTRLTADDGSPDDGFGSAVALRGDLAAVSAPGHHEGEGAVYVFRRSGTGWTRQAKVVPGEGAAGLGFGSSVALEGGTLLVTSASRRGSDASVYAFRRSTSGSGWDAAGMLTVSGLEERSGFGAAIALRDGIAFVGAPGQAQRVGAVFVFTFDADAGEWTSDLRLSPFVASPNAQFGASIAFDGANVWIGAPGDGVGGAVYAFGRDGDAWTGVTRLASESAGDRAALASASAVAGNLAVLGATGVDSRAGAAVVFEREAGGAWRERNMVVNEVRGLPAITGGEVACTDSHAAGYECADVNVVSFLAIKDIGGTRGTRVNDIWGWTDPETGHEYAIVGRTDGTAFVDISDPFRPVYVANLPKTEGSRSSIWRDMKVYRDHVYIVADAADEHGVQVFDLRQLRDVREPPQTFAPDYTYHGIHSAHNIVINEETGFAYAVGNSSGGETCGGGLHMISLEDPSRPTFAGCFADTNTGRRKTGYSHDAQCVTYRGPDVEHQGREICLGSNETALSIADVTDKDNPVALAAVSYPNVAYTHQGWLTEDQRYFYLNDEGDEPQGLVPGTRTLVWDVTDLDDPVLVNEHIANTTTTDHNLYVRGNLMYQSNYGSGLRILDVSDPANPVEIGFFDTTPYGGGGSWSNYPYFDSGLVVATSMSDGLFVLKSTGRPRLVP